MTPREMEEAYQKIAFGYDEPDVMWMLGSSIKSISAMDGHPVRVDRDGNPILDGTWYYVSRDGIALCQPLLEED